jgi:hypothetical protein
MRNLHLHPGDAALAAFLVWQNINQATKVASPVVVILTKHCLKTQAIKVAKLFF